MRKAAFFLAIFFCITAARATPANRTALDRHFDRFLPKKLNACTTCHLPSDKKDPQNLHEFPHNPFGNRLRLLRKELRADGKKADIAARLKIVAKEDSDGLLRPKAYVTLNSGATATAEEIIAFSRERLAHYKCPDTIEFGPLPKTSTGKVQKFVLREREWAGRETRVGST